MAQTQEQIKPSYGPAMSPKVFANKWLAKFFEYLEHKHHARARDISALAEEGLDLLCNFHKQAASLHLSEGDFPPELLPNVGGHVPKNDKIPHDRLGTTGASPFHAALIVLDLLDQIMASFFKVKAKGQTAKGKHWRDFSLKLRQRINDVLVRAEAVRDGGWWAFPDVEKLVEIEEKVAAAMAMERKEMAAKACSESTRS